VTVPKGQKLQPTSVVLRHATTLQKHRRDFRWVRRADDRPTHALILLLEYPLTYLYYYRWVRQANNHTEACRLPDIPLKKPFLGGNCLQPIIWLGLVRDNLALPTHSPILLLEYCLTYLPVPAFLWLRQNLTDSGNGVYEAYPPEPLINGHWTGYFIELIFPR
jgi:hypothetical protein